MLSNDNSFLGIVLCLIYGLSELGGMETFLNKVDKNRINTIDFSRWGLIILMERMLLASGPWS